MNPVLNHLQKTLLEFFKTCDVCKGMALFCHSALNLEEIMALRLSSAQPLQLGISYPFPVETAPDLGELCWSKLSFSCLLIQKLHTLPKESFLDLAERICFELSRQEFITETYECRFGLALKQPWQWITMKNKTALQMHFVTQKFNTLSV